MKLFESHEQRTSRLLHEAFSNAGDAIMERSPSAIDSHMHMAWLTGAWFSSQVALVIPTLNKAWARGTLNKAQALIKVFLPAMVALWYREIEKGQQRSEGEQRAARALAAQNLLSLFGELESADVSEFLNVEIQLKYDLSRHEDQSLLWLSNHVLFAQALQACGYATSLHIEWPSVPITSYGELMTVQGLLTNWNPVEVISFQRTVRRGASTMFDFYGNFDFYAKGYPQQETGEPR